MCQITETLFQQWWNYCGLDKKKGKALNLNDSGNPARAAADLSVLTVSLHQDNGHADDMVMKFIFILINFSRRFLKSVCTTDFYNFSKQIQYSVLSLL